MSLKSDGFTLVEVLIAISILFVMIQIIIPITTLLQQERRILSDRRLISALLHDEIQLFLQTENTDRTVVYQNDGYNQSLHFEFLTDRHLVTGCVTWENAKAQEEQMCYDAYKK